MSTNDVPGSNPANHDILAHGAWAEHKDGTLLYVEAVEKGRVIYAVFEMAQKPIIEYRDGMTEADFKKHFSWVPGDKRSIKWTWHDKTPFPWEKVIKAGARDGARYADVEDEIKEATRLAIARRKRREEVTAARRKKLPAPKPKAKEEDGDVAVKDVPETVAQRIAEERDLKGRDFNPEEHEHKVETVVGKKGANVFKRVWRAVRNLPPDAE